MISYLENQLGVVVAHAYNPIYSGGREVGGLMAKASMAKVGDNI
jgi:hypothetical protein